MTSSHHGLYAQGYTRPTVLGTTGSKSARKSKSLKAAHGSDRRLQFACVKTESLVIADQHAAVNTFPGLVHTARQAMGVRNAQSPRVSRAQGRMDDWG